MDVYLATGNPHKAAELSAFFAKSGGAERVFTAAEVGGMEPVAENAASFTGNARLKAAALKSRLSLQDGVVADDSGLEVDALQGAPGVRSARYAGLSATDSDNVAKLLNELKGVPLGLRSARFVCCLVLLAPEGEFTFTGVCCGMIATTAAGHNGFGYDPVFIPKGYKETLSQLGPGVKAHISHRAHAFRQLAQWLREKADRYPSRVGRTA